MKIELKRFTTNTRLSQETTAFAADVWVNGKKAGHAKNDGHGGATMVHLDRSIRDQVEAHGRALVPAEYKSFTGGAEWIVDQLVEVELQEHNNKAITSADAREKAKSSKQDLHTARFRHDDTWLWFAYKPGADPRAAADAIATEQNIVVNELVVLS